MLKIVIGTNEGKVLCISNNEDEIKASMVNYLIDTDQEPTEDFFESRNWGEYDIQVYEYHQPQLNENQQTVLEWVVKFEQYNKQFYFMSWIDLYSMKPVGYAKKDMGSVMKFTDLKKAEAVATLVDGSVEEV